MKKYGIFLLFIILAIGMTGCSEKTPKPEEQFSDYVKLWNEQKFNEMYDYLSTATKEKVSKKDFVERYTKIYKDLEINDLAITFTMPDEETDKKAEEATFPFHVKMNSLAGEISFDQKATWRKEESDKTAKWTMDWDTTMIFPDLEDGDKVTVQSAAPKRGAILDRNGDILAYNGEARQIGVVPGEISGQEKQVTQQLAKLLGMSTEEIENKLEQSWVQPDSFVPLKTIPLKDMDLREKLGQIPGVLGKNVEARVYPLGEKAAHLTGNLSQITAEDLEKYKGKGYTQTDMIGRRGLELVLEDRLRGEPGVKVVIQKEAGNEIVLAEKEVKDGEDVQLTIDSSIQSAVYKQLKGKKGAATVINPTTGETLALVSSPSYDPNQLTLGATNDQWKKIQDDPNNPLLNRFNTTFAPGSVLKPVTAAIGLKAGTLTWDTTLSIKGLTWGKDQSWGKYKVTRVSDPGVPIDLEKALIYSDNIYFAQTTLKLGKDKFIAGLKEFGFDEEMSYLFPMNTPKIGKIDSEIALADSSYGQGQIETNILHLASTYTTFINKGNMIKPILESNEKQGQIWKENIIDEQQAKNLVNGLRQVVENPHGTARGARIEGYPLAGKTGTAEYAKGEQGKKGKENGWFVAFNPEKSKYLVALMLEDNKSGTAVNDVKAIFEKMKK